jgi:hypothetical protein
MSDRRGTDPAEPSAPYEGDLLETLSPGLKPISANLGVLGLYAEGLSRRDSVKVAQYEVLGNDAKRPVRPARDDRNDRILVSHAAQRLPPLVDRPVRDGYHFKNANPALRTGLLSPGPCGTAFSNHQQRS